MKGVENGHRVRVIRNSAQNTRDHALSHVLILNGMKSSKNVKSLDRPNFDRSMCHKLWPTIHNKHCSRAKVTIFPKLKFVQFVQMGLKII